MSKNNLYILFSLGLTVLVLWTLLLPGYILIMDQSAGPVVTWPVYSLSTFSNYLSQVLLYGLGVLVGGMWAQKIFLFFLFFIMAYLPLRYFPSEVEEIPKYIGSLFFVVNPFVFERMLAGQWGVLFGYALFVPFIYFLIKFLQEVKINNLIRVLLASFVVGAFSFHFYVMSAVVFFITIPFWILKIQKSELQEYVVTGFMFILLNLFWVVTQVEMPQNIIETFNGNNAQAFVTNTVPGEVLGFLGVFTGYGFWGEHEGWRNTYNVNEFVNWYWWLPIYFLVLLGMFNVYKNNKKIFFPLVIILLTSSVFSVGVAETMFKNFNQFLFDNISFWVGFRDSQKWSGVLILIMEIFLVFCLSQILRYKYLIYLLVVVSVLVYQPTMLFGVSPKIQPIMYPKEWFEVNEILKQDKNCVAVFLPWEMYYEPQFNKKVLTANPARKVFNCKVYTSLDPEFKGIGDVPSLDDAHIKIHKIMKGEKSQVIEGLRGDGVKYLIVTIDEFQKGEYNEIFKGNVKAIYVQNAIVLVQILDIL